MPDAPSTGKVRRLNRRQQKKRRVGEFQVLVFEVKLTYKTPLDARAYDTFIDAFIDMVEARDLGIYSFAGGALVTETDGVVMKCPRGSVSEAERLDVIEWLERRPEVATVAAGELVDGNYGWHDDA